VSRPNLPRSWSVDATGRLRVAGCDLGDLVARFGTPLYVFESGDLRENARRVVRAFAAARPGSLVVFASKALPLVAAIELFARESLGVDVSTAGELETALAADVPPASLVLHGNAKSDDELRRALEVGVGLVVVDNATELERLEALGARRQPVLLRIRPDVEADTVPAIATGGAGSKFGVGREQARGLLSRMARSPAVAVAGLHAHVGSQIRDPHTLARSVAVLGSLGSFDRYDLGGGLATPYRADDPPTDVEGWARALAAAAREHLPAAAQLIVEPGRCLVGPSGLTLYRVVVVKDGPIRHVAVDGGLADNLEAAIGGVTFEAHIVDRPFRGSPHRLVGKQCESGDVLVERALLDAPARDDLVVVPATGAYTWTTASNYNALPRPAVVFCEDGRAEPVCERETVADLLRRQRRLRT
jgi:diaminopimelate decarboxylase